MYSTRMNALLLLKPVLKTIHKLLWLVFILLNSACEQHPEPQSAVNKIATDDENSLIFLVHPYDTPSQLITRFQPLCSYLEKQTGRAIKLELASSYVDQIRRISNGSADLAYMGPTPFLRAQDHYLKGQSQKLIPLAAEAINGQVGYHSVIVVSSGSPVQFLRQLKGRSVAFGAPHSFSSHYAPRTLLAAAGLGFTDLLDYAFLGSHERVALAVLHGDFDAGGLRQSVAEKYAHREPGLKIIKTSPPLPPHLIVARPNFDKQVAGRIKEALLKPTADFAKAGSALGTGIYFVYPDLSLFQSARKVVQAIEAKTEVPEQW